MRTRQLTPAPAVDLAHEQASLIAQLALQSTFAAEDVETYRELLTRFSPARILAGLDQAWLALEAEGGPDFPQRAADVDSFCLLRDGLRHLDRLTQELPQPLLAAA